MTFPAERRVWRRTVAAPTPDELPIGAFGWSCGDFSARPSPEPEPAKTDDRAGPPEDETEDEADEKKQERYAMKLLRQDDAAWGGGAVETGVLG